MLKQQAAMDDLVKACSKDSSVLAIFVKGSIARGEADAYSDVDLYCIVDPVVMPTFLKGRLTLLESHRPLLYWSEANFGAPQIVAVYDNGLHVDLYTLTEGPKTGTDAILPLYDPKNLLANYQQIPVIYPDEALVANFNHFAFSLIEFEAAYQRGDMLWTIRLASHQFAELSMILSAQYDKGKSFIGLKRLSGALPHDLRLFLEGICQRMTIAEVKNAMLQMIDLAISLYGQMSPDIQSRISIDLIQYGKEAIGHLPQKKVQA